MTFDVYIYIILIRENESFVSIKHKNESFLLIKHNII